MFENQYDTLVKLRYDQLLQEAEDWRCARSVRREQSLLHRSLKFLDISSHKILQNRYSLRVLSAIGMKLSTN